MRQYFTLFLFVFLAGSLFSQTAPGGIPQGYEQIKTSPQNTYVEPPLWQQSIINSSAFVFATTTYTFQDIVLFSYFDQSVFYLIAQDGTPLDTVSLNKDEFHTFSPGTGIFHIESNNTFTSLIGDPVSNNWVGYFAVDESGSPLSTRINTFMPDDWYGTEHFILFAYYENTEFTIKNITDTSTVAAGILNAGEHVVLDNVFSKFLSISSNKPVSALSYTDQGYYVPASNGTFAGTQFYGYSGTVGGWTNGIVVTAYTDSTKYIIFNSTTGDTLSQGILSIGEATQLAIYQDTFWEVQTDKSVTVSNTPFAAWSGSYYYLTRQIDETGLGIGTHFITPVVSGNYDIFSFGDNNQILIINMWTGDTVFNDILNNAEHYNFTSSKALYEVTSSENLSIITSYGGSAGADYVPLNFAVGLPDLSISAADIMFVPDSVERVAGDPITIYATVHNFGFETAYNVPVQFFDGDPSGGLAISSVMYADSIPAGENYTFNADWNVPVLPEYHAVHVIVDQYGSIVESNSSNNSSFKFIVPNKDLLPPLSVTVDAPVSIKVTGDTLEFNLFDMCINLFNTGNVAATNASSVLSLPNGLSTDQPDSVNFGDIPENSSAETCWVVNIDSLPTGTSVRDGITNQKANEEAFFYSFKINADNAEEKWINRMLLISRPTSIQNRDVNLATPSAFHLKQNYPNPFNPNTTIEYHISKTSHVLLDVYDITGRKVSTLVNGQIQPGHYKTIFEGVKQSSGVFFIRLNIDGKNLAVKRMMLIK